MSAQTEYLASINHVLSTYTDKYVQRGMLGSYKERNWETIKFLYASAIVEILTQYFGTTITGDDNFMTASEAEGLMQHFCDITRSYYFLKLT